MAYASLGFFLPFDPVRPTEVDAAASVCDVIVLWRFIRFVVALIPLRSGNDVLLRRPISKILQSAALAAKREIGIRRRVGQSLTNRTSALHKNKSTLTRAGLRRWRCAS